MRPGFFVFVVPARTRIARVNPEDRPSGFVLARAPE
jgi:hypothetical protein